MNKTLSEFLTELAGWIDDEGGLWQEYFSKQGLASNAQQAYGEKAQECRKWAERVNGKVFIAAVVDAEDHTIDGELLDHRYYYAYVKGFPFYCKSSKCDEALSQLQALLDAEVK